MTPFSSDLFIHFFSIVIAHLKKTVAPTIHVKITSNLRRRGCPAKFQVARAHGLGHARWLCVSWNRNVLVCHSNFLGVICHIVNIILPAKISLRKNPLEPFFYTGLNKSFLSVRSHYLNNYQLLLNDFLCIENLQLVKGCFSHLVVGKAKSSLSILKLITSDRVISLCTLNPLTARISTDFRS